MPPEDIDISKTGKRDTNLSKRQISRGSLYAKLAERRESFRLSRALAEEGPQGGVPLMTVAAEYVVAC